MMLEVQIFQWVYYGVQHNIRKIFQYHVTLSEKQIIRKLDI